MYKSNILRGAIIIGDYILHLLLLLLFKWVVIQVLCEPLKMLPAVKKNKKQTPSMLPWIHITMVIPVTCAHFFPAVSPFQVEFSTRNRHYCFSEVPTELKKQNTFIYLCFILGFASIKLISVEASIGCYGDRVILRCCKCLSQFLLLH